MASKRREANEDSLDELLECAIDRGADFGSFVEVDSRHSTLANALWSKLEFLCKVSALLATPLNTDLKCLPCKHPCKHR